MAKNKYKPSSKSDNQPTQPANTPAAQKDVNTTSSPAVWQDYKQTPIIPLQEQAQVMFGTSQQNNKAPMEVPAGFSSQVTYQSGINSAIVANPLLIPLEVLYKLATTEPVVSSDMAYWIAMLVSRIGPYKNPIKKYQDHGEGTLKCVNFTEVKRAMGTSCYMGFSVIAWEYGKVPTTGRDGIIGKKHLPQNSIQFAVTPEGKIDDDYGVLHRYYGTISNTMNNWSGYGATGINAITNVGGSDIPPRQTGVNLVFVSALPKMWRMVTTFNPQGYNGNPYGEPLTKKSYSAVVSKWGNWAKLETAMTFKAFPLNIIETNTETTVQYGDGTTASAQQDLIKNMAKAMSSGVLVTGYGLNSLKINTVENTADIEKMIKSIEMCDYQIRVAHCSSDFVSNNGTFASAKVNADAQKEFKNTVVEYFVDVLMEQLIKPTLHAGFGEHIEDYGYFEILDNSIDDKLKWADLYQKAAANGSYDPTDIEQLNYAQRKQGLFISDKITSTAMLGLNTNHGGDTSAVKEIINEPYSKGLEADAKTDE